MKITNRKLLQEFRTPGYCECCNLNVAKRQPHHLWRRNPELTVRINLIALGGILNLSGGRERFLCRCHRSIHDGQIEAGEILGIVALREKVSVQEIVEVMQWFRRHIKPTALQLEIALEELSAEGRLIVDREFAESPKRRRS